MRIGMIIFTGLLTLSVGPVAAQQLDETGTSAPESLAHLPADAVVDRDYFTYGDYVTISGTVNGDVYAAGREIVVDGRVNGDLIAAGRTVRVSGTVSQDARLAGRDVVIAGQIARNLSAAGQRVELADSALVGGGAVMAGDGVTLGGRVGGDVKLAARSATVSGRLDGNVATASGDLRLMSSAVIARDLTHWNRRPPVLDPGAEVQGIVAEKAFPEWPWPDADARAGMWASALLFLKLVSAVSTLIVGIALITVFPGATHSALVALYTRPGASFGAGVLAVAALPLAVAILLATVLAAPVGAMLAALGAVAVYVGRVVVILWIGYLLIEWWSADPPRSGWALVLGFVMYYAATFIPFAGTVLALGAALFGMGAAIVAIRTTNDPNRDRTADDEVELGVVRRWDRVR